MINRIEGAFERFMGKKEYNPPFYKEGGLEGVCPTHEDVVKLADIQLPSLETITRAEQLLDGKNNFSETDRKGLIETYPQMAGYIRSYGDNILALVTADLHIPGNLEHSRTEWSYPNRAISKIMDAILHPRYFSRGISYYADIAPMRHRKMFEALPAKAKQLLSKDSSVNTTFLAIDLGDMCSDGTDQEEMKDGYKKYKKMVANISSTMSQLREPPIVKFSPGDHCDNMKDERGEGERQACAVAERFRSIGSQVSYGLIGEKNALLVLNSNLLSKGWWKNLSNVAINSLLRLQHAAEDQESLIHGVYTIDTLMKHTDKIKQLLELPNLKPQQLQDIENLLVYLLARQEEKLQNLLIKMAQLSDRYIICAGHCFRPEEILPNNKYLHLAGHRHYSNASIPHMKNLVIPVRGTASFHIGGPGEIKYAGFGINTPACHIVLRVSDSGINYEWVKITENDWNKE